MRSVVLCYLALALSSAGLLAQSAGWPEKGPVTVEGVVGNALEPGMFWLESSGRRVLVYSSPQQTAALEPGERVRIDGEVPQDWMKLAEREVRATEIRRLPR